MRLGGFGFALMIAWLAWARAAKADLGADVTELMRVRLAYGHVEHLKPRLLERGDRLPIELSPELLNPKDSSCATLSILGVPGTHFVIRFSEVDPGALNTAFPEASAVGAVDVTRCGRSKPFLSAIVLEMRSPRGVLETLLSVTPAGVPKLSEVLPARDPGMELPLGDPGERPLLPPLKERLQRLAARAERERAANLQIENWRATADGSGAGPVSLSAGCHELVLLADSAPPNAESAVDLDVELVDEEGGARLAADRGEEADARVTWCTGEPVSLALRFVGAAPDSTLSLSHARWDLPPGLPKAWGPEVVGSLARVAHLSGFWPQSPPVYQSLGVQGTTQLTLEVEPDACYSLLLAPLRGEVRGLSLSAFAHMPGEVTRGAVDNDGTRVSFCARGATHATVQVDGEGSNLTWLLAAFESGRTRLGTAAP